MDEAAKKRLIGAVVLVLLMVIFVPMLFEEPAPPGTDDGAALEVPQAPPSQSAPSREVFISTTMPEPDDQSLVADEMAPLDALTTDEMASFAGEESASPPPVATRVPVEPVAEPAPVDQPAVGASRPTPPAEPPQQTRPSAQPAGVSQAASPPVVRRGAYVVQIAALSTAERASALAEELRRQGFSSFTQKAEVGGKTYFRVRVGPEADRAAAERLAEAVARKTGHQGQILVNQ